MDFLTALRVFNFLCLPPKGFFIDKALGSVGSAVEEKLLMERLVIGDMRGLLHWDNGSEEATGAPRPGMGSGRGSPSTQCGHTEHRSQDGPCQEPGCSEEVAKAEISALENRCQDLSNHLRESGT